MKKTIFIGILILFLFSVFSQFAFGAKDSQRGKNLYQEKCQMCHGANGNGKGPAAQALNPPPQDFKNASFWKGNHEKLISETIKNGKGQMPAFDLKKEDIRDLIRYMTEKFKP